MEVEIKRVRFFDGQFLKEGEFLEEQIYHLHMRRRLNYVLFDQSGVLPIDSVDDLRFVDIDVGNRTFRVQAGMAIARHPDIRECKEIILREDTAVIDLAAEGILAGGTAWVTIHYAEEGAADPPSEGDVQEDTRMREHAMITVHSVAPPALEPTTSEPMIVLGQIDFDSMVADYTQRQEAQIRASLIGAGPSPVTPTITGIAPPSGAVGSTITVQISGTSLAGASAISFSGTGITPTIQPGGTATSFDVELVIDAGAAVGARTFSVTTPQGTANSGAIVFGVSAVAVSVTSIAPTLANIQAVPPGGNLTVRGSNIRAASLNTGDPAAGTVVQLVEVGDPSNVLATCTNPVVLANIGPTQQVQVTLPLNGDFSAQLSPVSVQVLFGGGSDTAPQNLTLFF
jgi:hypothetical protein